MEKIYWTTKDGRKMNVDDMDDNHVRNAFKMLLRNIAKQEENINNKKKARTQFELKGEMAQMFNDDMELAEMQDDLEPYAFDYLWK